MITYLIYNRLNRKSTAQWFPCPCAQRHTMHYFNSFQWMPWGTKLQDAVSNKKTQITYRNRCPKKKR